MKKIWIGIGVVVLVALAIMFFVTQTKKEPEVIKIGVVMSQTGPIAPYGEKGLRGIQIAVEEINEKGGIRGKKVLLITEDAKSSPKDAVAALQKLIAAHKIPVVIGPLASSLAMSCAPIANSEKVVFLSPGASALDYTSLGDYTFRNWPIATLIAEKMAEIAYGKMNLRNIAVLYVNNDMGISYKSAFADRFTKLGGKIIITDFFEQGSTDIRAQLTKIKNKNPQAIYLLGQAVEDGHALRQIKEMGIKAQILSNIGIEDPTVINIAGNAADGAIYTIASYNPKNPLPQVQEYERRYETKFGDPSDAFAATSYDAVYILKESIEKGGFKSEGIKNALFKIKNFPGVTGSTSFDENGDVVKPVAVKGIKKGKFIFLDENLREFE